MKIRSADADKAIADVAAWNSRLLASFGPTHEARAARIAAVYQTRESVAYAAYAWLFDGAAGNGGFVVEQGYCSYTVSRSLATMTNREREHLRIIDLLLSVTDGGFDQLWAARAALVRGDGKANLEAWSAGPRVTWHRIARPIDQFLQGSVMSVDQVVSWVQQTVGYYDALPELPPAYRQVIEEAKSLISPSGTGAWLRPDQLTGTAFDRLGAYPLHLGSFADGSALTYSGDGSIITVAPPGAGKTQCNVIPNLLTWQGPAVVLDVSGDLYEHTAAWRAANVGPVYRFSPLDPDVSHRFNPLTFVRNNPDYIWEDARLLAEMMIVPSSSLDPFWENEARTVLTAAVASVCYGNEPSNRPMHALLDILFGGAAWDAMIAMLRMAIDVRVMTQHATSLSGMNDKTLSSVLQTARSSLSAWTGQRIARATSHSDWDPADLRGPDRPTIYVCVRPNEVESYLSLLRVVIGQHIRVLTGGSVPARDAAPILFMLDEMPRLRFMPPIDEALNIGRKYGLRLWMFAQSVGQVQASYPNAEGMLSACAVRTYMNAGGADGLADRLSEELGYIDSINDNTRRKLVEAAELSGPAYKDQQIVLGVGSKPAKVRKDFAWQHPELSRRMSLVSP